MNPQDLIEMISPYIFAVTDRVGPVINASIEEAKQRHDSAGLVKRVFYGYLAGVMAAKVANVLAG